MKGSLQIKSNKYYAVFRINGKLKWHNLNIEAKRGTKREAERAMVELIAQYNKTPAVFHKTDFVEYINEWLEEVKNQIDIVTYEGYEQYAKKHIIPYFESKHLMLQDVSIRDIENYYNNKAKSGRLDGKPGGLSIRTLKLHGVVLSLVFKKAIHDGILTTNPCTYAKLPKIERAQPIAKFYTVEQCKKLLEPKAHRSMIWYILQCFMAYDARN